MKFKFYVTLVIVLAYSLAMSIHVPRNFVSCYNYCHNNATCSYRLVFGPNNTRSYHHLPVCKCAPNYTGRQCELRAPANIHCNKYCFHNASCVYHWAMGHRHNGTRLYRVYHLVPMCLCLPGYAGVRCEYDETFVLECIKAHGKTKKC